MESILRVNKKNHCNHCPCFPPNIRSLIIGSSGSGKTALLLNYLIRECPIQKMYYWDYNTLILVSTSLAQDEYQWLIKSYKAKLNRDQIETLFKVQKNLQDIDKSIDTVVQQMKVNKYPENDIEIITCEDPKELASPKILNNLHPGRKILVVCDDSMTLDKKKITNLFSAGRPLNINTVYILQKYFYRDTKTIRDNANHFIIFNTSIKDSKEIYKEIGGSFNTEKDIIKYCNNSSKERYSYISYNKDTDKWSNSSDQNFGLASDQNSLEINTGKELQEMKIIKEH